MAVASFYFTSNVEEARYHLGTSESCSAELAQFQNCDHRSRVIATLIRLEP